ncbi:MAG: SCO family protein [Vicinamibacterales bacterium]
MRILLAAILGLILAGPAFAQMTGAPAPGYRRDVGTPASAIPEPLREIGFDQRMGEAVPLDVDFTDESGRVVKLGEFFGTKPVVLAFVYYECPMLCTQTLRSMASSFGVLSMNPGEDFEIVLVSIDPRETPEVAARRKAEVIERYGRTEAAGGWHFLTGKPDAIERVAGAAGFRYAWDEQTQQYAHPAGIVILTPDGRAARYLFGLDYGPRDLRLAMIEASEGTIGTAVDAILLYCYHYDPMTGRYGLVVMRLLRVAGVATVLAIGAFIVVMLRRERRTPGNVRST